MDIDGLINRMTELWETSVEEEYALDEETAASGTNQPEEPAEPVDPVADDPLEEVSPEDDGAEEAVEVLEQAEEAPAQDEDRSPEGASDDSLDVAEEPQATAPEPEPSDEVEDTSVADDLQADPPEEPEETGLQEEPEQEQEPEEDLRTIDESAPEDGELPEDPTIEPISDELPPDPDTLAEDYEQPLLNQPQKTLKDSSLSDIQAADSESDSELPVEVPVDGKYRSTQAGGEQDAAGLNLGADFFADLNSALSPQIAELRHVITANLQDTVDREAILMDAMTLE
jgi:hypothetical protein